MKLVGCFCNLGSLCPWCIEEVLCLTEYELAGLRYRHHCDYEASQQYRCNNIVASKSVGDRVAAYSLSPCHHLWLIDRILLYQRFAMPLRFVEVESSEVGLGTWGAKGVGA